MENCLFCKIVDGKTPSFKIYEDDHYYAFLDIAQFTEGHTLVIPKKHIQFVWDSREIDRYFKVVQKIAQHYRSLGFSYVDSITLGRMIPHAHVHLIPYNSDSADYQKALEGIGLLQARKIDAETGKRIVQRFKLPESD